MAEDGRTISLRVALAVGAILYLFWGLAMIFFPSAAHDMMAPDKPFDIVTTKMLGGVLLALAVGAIMAISNPRGDYKELVHFLPVAYIIVFIIALYSILGGAMASSLSTWSSLIVDGAVAAALIAMRP